MLPDAPNPDAQRTEAFINDLANGILDTFRRHHIPTHIALGAIGVVAGDLLDRVQPQLARDWVDAFKAATPDA